MSNENRTHLFAPRRGKRLREEAGIVHDGDVAHEEVDEVLGDQPIQVGDLSKLKYLAGMSCIIAFELF